MNNDQSNNQDFNQEIENAIILYEKCVGHFATRTRSMIKQHGIIKALEKLMDNADLQKGFKTLRDKNMLDKTFEAVMIKYKDKININKKAIEVAKFRYNNPYWEDKHSGD